METEKKNHRTLPPVRRERGKDLQGLPLRA